MIKESDHTGKACKDYYKIGMNRLSIIDLDNGNQPIYNDKKTIFTVLNGEIYNYVELRKTLKKVISSKLKQIRK